MTSPAFVLFASSLVVAATVASGTGRTFVVQDDAFLMDGKPFQIRSGSLHYFRVPRAYWKDRLMRAKAMGLNAVQTVIPWNWHEEREGIVRWDGDRDLEAYVRTAQDLNMSVLLRPGPYICAEWDFGGFPGWILRHNVTAVRTFEPNFIKLMDAWWSQLMPRIKPLLYQNGGPVIMVQLENEYGSFGDVSMNPADRRYMEHLLAQARQYLGGDVVLYTTDGNSLDCMHRGSLPGSDVLTLGDGGWSCDAQAHMNPKGKNPCMNTEDYSGWLTHWGEKMANTSSGDFGVSAALRKGYSFSLYMAHGGSNFGWMAGANGGGKDFQPHITSYDYNSPISEDGSHGIGSDGGDKYKAFRDAMLAFGDLVDEPPTPAKTAYGKVRLGEAASMLSTSSLHKLRPEGPIHFANGTLGFFEADLGLNYGFAYYTAVANGAGSVLSMDTYPRDRVQVFVDGEYQGAIFRPETAPLKLRRRATVGISLGLLVENMGRLNFGKEMLDKKGIAPKTIITLDGEAAAVSWSAWPLTMNYPEVSSLEFAKGASCARDVGPTFYRGYLDVDGSPTDTYLRPEGFTKGVMWVNGVNIGRYWQAKAPQRAFYVPAPYLQTGRNDVILLELEKGPDDCIIVFDDHADLSAAPPSELAMRSFGHAPDALFV